MKRLLYQYLIPIGNDDPEQASPFQGFTEGILNIPPALGAILRLPISPLEFALDQERLLAARMSNATGYFIAPIEKRLLREIPETVLGPFVVVVSAEDTEQETNDFVAESRIPILHIKVDSKYKYGIDVTIESDRLRHYAIDILDSIDPSGSTEHLIALKTALLNARAKPRIQLSLATRNHLSTLPNEIALLSTGFDLAEETQLIGTTDDTYVSAILASAREVETKRSMLLRQNTSLPPGLSLLLTAPSVYKHLYVRFKHCGSQFGKDGPRAAKLLRQIVKRKHFFFNLPDGFAHELQHSPVLQAILSTQAMEMRAFTSGVAVRATSHFCPTLRISPAINSLAGNLSRLGLCARSNGPHRAWKSGKLVREIQRQLQDVLKEDYLEWLKNPFSEIKIMSDIPLEWLGVGGVPLSIHCNASRIPTTPGNLFLGMAIRSHSEILPMNSLDNILIVRAFDDGDPLRNVLRFTTDFYNLQSLGRDDERASVPKFKTRVKLHWVDVQNRRELVDALNAFEGVVMVFDGHGSGGDPQDPGHLVIGRDRVDAWSLRKEARIPPIVLLSACDTHPADSHHASTANGFLAAGATTVLATLLPVSGTGSAVLIARLLFRLEEFLPAVFGTSTRAIRWSSVVGGVLRRQYVSEILFKLEKRRKLSEGDFYRISYATGMLSDALNPKWYEYFLSETSVILGYSEEELSALLESPEFVPECIRYTQLGNPDLLVITA